jgi:predicted secreted Zn-dependent protease
VRRLLAAVCAAGVLATAVPVAAALFSVVFSQGSDDEVVQRTHARFIGGKLSGSSCDDVVDRAVEPGFATIGFRYEFTGLRRVAERQFAGRVTFSLGDVTITAPRAIVWPHMSRSDRDRAETLRRAIVHHEIGHVRVAEAVRDEMNARDAVTAPDRAAFSAAADALGHEGFARFKSQERDYDAFTDHGRRQHEAPGVLAGPDSVIVCR